MKHPFCGATLLCLMALGACAPVAVLGGGAVVARSVAQERSTGDALGDNAIAIRINNALIRESAGLFTNVTVDVTEGRVILLGAVPRVEDKVTATRLSWATPGVVGVEDALEVSDADGIGTYFSDLWISNRLRAKLIGDPKVASVNYSVETVAGAVHLTGLARSGPELQRVIDHAAATPGVTRVVSHVLTIDDPRRVAAAATPG